MSDPVDPELVLQSLIEAMAAPGLPGDVELPTRAAAVAVVVHVGGGEPRMLWIQRAEHPQDPWSGQMAFPGGHGEAGDESTRATAERETHEELGLTLAGAATHLGTLAELRARNRAGLAGFRIVPHVYWLPELPALQPDPAEVAATHQVPLSHLLDPGHRTTLEYERAGRTRPLPAIRYGDRLIWGLSHRILQDLLTRLAATRLGRL